MKKETERQIAALRKLGLSDKEIQEVLEDDKRIEKGEKLFELSAEQEKESKKARQVSKAPTIYQLDNKEGKRSKKEDNDKATLLKTLFSAILPICETYEITNGERVFCFTYKGRKFKVVLSAPRK